MNPIDAYMKSSVQTASPMQQVILLYDKAILSLKMAKESIEKNDIKTKIEQITKCQDIIRALDSALDFEKGGDIAKNLHSLYDFIESSLFKAHANNDIKLIEDLIEILSTLKEGWEGIESKI